MEIYANLCSDDGFTDGPQGMKIDRCMLVEESKLMSKHATFEDIGMSFLTLFRIATGDNWSEVMNSCQLEPGPRRSGDAAVRTAISYIKEYIATGSYTYLEMARSELPACQTLEELEAMKEVVTCRYPDEFGSCPSTCGVKIISNLLFSAFLCASNFILLNLVMAVLMQELQAAIVEPEVKANMAVASLVAMSKATSKMTQKLNNSQKEGGGEGGDGNGSMENSTSSRNKRGSAKLVKTGSRDSDMSGDNSSRNGRIMSRRGSRDSASVSFDDSSGHGKRLVKKISKDSNKSADDSSRHDTRSAPMMPGIAEESNLTTAQ